jgi:pimeloyl-ACP methyl ester carboxylesterase
VGKVTAGPAWERLISPPPNWAQSAWAERLAIEASHFASALGGEAKAIAKVGPGFLLEWLRSGFYPSGVSFRKLPYFPERGDLAALRSLNPAWAFRSGFDPEQQVLVFLHGYIDNSGAIAIANLLAARGYQVYLVRYPFLRSVRQLSGELVDALERIAERERGKAIIPLGHSLGGFVWDDLLLHRPEIIDRFRMPLYISMGSPRFGTLAAYLGFGASARDMRPGSALLRDHRSRRFPPGFEVYPFVSRFDLFVLPIETALLRSGINYVFSETGHLAQVARRETVAAIEEILATPRDVLLERSEERPFWPSALSWLLGGLPRSLRDRIGVGDLLEDVFDGNQPPGFRVRIVHHELRTGTLPLLRHPPARTRH